MSAMNLEITPIKLKDLQKFALKFMDKTGSLHTSPITLARARAQMKNPFAQENDIVLFAGFKNGRCIGYHGQLPGALFTQKGIRRVFWGSTFYIQDEYRGRGLGKKFLRKVTGLNQDFVTTRITPEAINALKSFGLKKLGELTYYQLRVERSHWLAGAFALGRSKEPHNDSDSQWARRMEKIEKITARFEKFFFYAGLFLQVKRLLHGYDTEKAEKILASDFFSNPSVQPPFFYRGPEIINWMLTERWVRSSAETIKDVRNYYFSDDRKIFKYIPLKLFDQKKQEYRGFLILCASTHKNRTLLRVLDHSLKTFRDIPAACGAALQNAIFYRADRVELPEKWGEYLGQKNFFEKFLKKQTREYFYYPKKANSRIDRLRGKIRLDYCDGDIAFT